ncbi:hypothetical protein B0H11DRAFT_1933121 [Mycena galericulata]|nr:hypothetical protein B0H11DRAFT_1933121 [Mycena galericulata]
MVDDDSDDEEDYALPAPTANKGKGLAHATNESSGSESSGNESGSMTKPAPGPGGFKSRITKDADRRRKHRKTTPSRSSDPTAVDGDGMLLDVWLEESWECPACRSLMTAAPVCNFDSEAAIRFDHPDFIDNSKSITVPALMFFGFAVQSMKFLWSSVDILRTRM